MDKTAHNTESKSSFYILLSEKNSRIRTRFNPLIQLDRNKKYEMALVNLETYYSFPNNIHRTTTSGTHLITG